MCAGLMSTEATLFGWQKAALCLFRTRPFLCVCIPGVSSSFDKDTIHIGLWGVVHPYDLITLISSLMAPYLQTQSHWVLEFWYKFGGTQFSP